MSSESLATFNVFLNIQKSLMIENIYRFEEQIEPKLIVFFVIENFPLILKFEDVTNIVHEFIHNTFKNELQEFILKTPSGECFVFSFKRLFF